MGWRERDYAKWTDDERKTFLGSLAPARASGAGGGVFRAGAGVAIAASVALLVLGHFPRGHPLLPAFHFTVPSLHRGTHKAAAAVTVARIALPHSAAVGSFLTLRGQLPAGESGTVSVDGAYVRPPWRLLAAVPATAGSYTARVQLSHKGLLHLRVVYPDGHHSVGSIRVR
jgi:hypothetical protein